MQPRKEKITPVTPPKVQRGDLHRRKDCCIFSPAEREKKTREREDWSYLVRGSVWEAGWWWVCLTAPLGRNKVNSSHFQSLQEVK